MAKCDPNTLYKLKDEYGRLFPTGFKVTRYGFQVYKIPTSKN